MLSKIFSFGGIHPSELTWDVLVCSAALHGVQFSGKSACLHLEGTSVQLTGVCFCIAKGLY
jgi:hypothetical protein